jgi:hypothetical protein
MTYDFQLMTPVPSPFLANLFFLVPHVLLVNSTDREHNTQQARASLSLAGTHHRKRLIGNRTTKDTIRDSP